MAGDPDSIEIATASEFVNKMKLKKTEFCVNPKISKILIVLTCINIGAIVLVLCLRESSMSKISIFPIK